MKEKGITLIALIVTIIVLIILAGITIATLTGEDGIINNANNAKEETEIANEKEIVDRATINAMGNNKRGNIVKDELQDELDRITKVGDTEVDENGDEFSVLFVNTNRYYIVDIDGDIIEEGEIVVDKSPGDITVGIDGEILDGSEEHPYEIWCIEDLMEWSQNYAKYQNSHIKLCTNLNFQSKLSYADSQTKEYGDVNKDGNSESLITELQSGEGFKPIQQFYGNFNGENHIINNLYISKQDKAGLIIYLNNANLKNITIKGEVYSESNYAGIIAQAGNSQIENIISDTKIYGGTGAGMICKCSGKQLNIKNCKNLGDIEAITAGGICGDSFVGEMLNCINKGTIKSSASANYGTGGLCGNNSGKTVIRNCINQGTVIYDGNKGVWYFGGAGGMIGLNRQKGSIIQNCINTGKIESTSYAGAICGMDLTYWESQEKYELINSFMLNNVEKATGSNEVEETATVFKKEDIQEVVTSLNIYINDNDLSKEGWKLWKVENDELIFQ